MGFYSLLYLAQALGKQLLDQISTGPTIVNNIELKVVTSNIQEVTGEESLSPEKATVLGPCKVIPREYTNVTCCSIDVVMPPPNYNAIAREAAYKTDMLNHIPNAGDLTPEEMATLRLVVRRSFMTKGSISREHRTQLVAMGLIIDGMGGVMPTPAGRICARG